MAAPKGPPRRRIWTDARYGGPQGHAPASLRLAAANSAPGEGDVWGVALWLYQHDRGEGGSHGRGARMARVEAATVAAAGRSDKERGCYKESGCDGGQGDVAMGVGVESW